jgi:transposase-like protein
MEKKVCSKCKEEKEVCEFGKDDRYLSGLKSICKKCNRNYSKKNYQLKRDKILEEKKIYYIENDENKQKSKLSSKKR